MGIPSLIHVIGACIRTSLNSSYQITALIYKTKQKRTLITPFRGMLGFIPFPKAIK